MAWKFDPEELVARLTHLGYEVRREDLIVGLRRDGLRLWEVFVDGGGRVRLLMRRKEGPPIHGRVERAGKVYSWARCVHEEVEVVSQIDALDEVETVVHTAEALACADLERKIFSAE